MMETVSDFAEEAEVGDTVPQGVESKKHAAAIKAYADAEQQRIEQELQKRLLEATRVEAEINLDEMNATKAEVNLLKKLNEIGVALQRDQDGNLTITKLAQPRRFYSCFISLNTHRPRKPAPPAPEPERPSRQPPQPTGSPTRRAAQPAAPARRRATDRPMTSRASASSTARALSSRARSSENSVQPSQSEEMKIVSIRAARSPGSAGTASPRASR